MQKLFGAAFLLAFFIMAQASAFAAAYKCEFKDEVIAGVESIEMTDTVLVINNSVNIQIEESRIRCANFGQQKRYDGRDDIEQLQVVLKTCTSDAAMEGYLIDAKSKTAAEVTCDRI